MPLNWLLLILSKLWLLANWIVQNWHQTFVQLILILLNTEDNLWLYFMNFFLYAFGKCRDADLLGWLFRYFSPFKSFWNVSVDAEIDPDQVWCSFIGSNLGLITIDSIKKNRFLLSRSCHGEVLQKQKTQNQFQFIVID